jgi:hypothetical protein
LVGGGGVWGAWMGGKLSFVFTNITNKGQLKLQAPNFVE